MNGIAYIKGEYTLRERTLGTIINGHLAKVYEIFDETMKCPVEQVNTQHEGIQRINELLGCEIDEQLIRKETAQ